MKKLLFFFLGSLVCPALWTGCQEIDEIKDAGEEITVALNLTGDFDVDVSQDPLTRASSSNDAYAVEVRYDNGVYAYGLFDNVEDMTITLLSNHTYSFYCTLVKDAKNTLYYGQAFNNTYSGYAYPFHTSASNSTQITNRFIVGTGVTFSGMKSGRSHIISTTSPSTSNYTQYPQVDRYYGVTTGYVPVQNGTIDIYLKRTVFGARFVVNGLKEGSLSVDASNSTYGSFHSKTYYSDTEGTETIYTFPDVGGVYSNDLPLVATVSLKYDSNRGDLWDMSQSKDIQFKRNVMTTVNIDLNPDFSGAKFSVTEEPMEEDNVIDMGINTDGLIDIVVKPEN